MEGEGCLHSLPRKLCIRVLDQKYSCVWGRSFTSNYNKRSNRQDKNKQNFSIKCKNRVLPLLIYNVLCSLVTRSIRYLNSWGVLLGRNGIMVYNVKTEYFLCSFVDLQCTHVLPFSASFHSHSFEVNATLVLWFSRWHIWPSKCIQL